MPRALGPAVILLVAVLTTDSAGQPSPAPMWPDVRGRGVCWTDPGWCPLPVLLLFLLPQAFPQLPVFASATREFYRFGLAGTIPGVVLVHLAGGLVFAVWTMTAVFRSIAPELEEAAWNLGASTTRAFLGVSLPLALPGIVASAVLVFLYSLDEFTGTLLVGAPFVTTLPVYMYTASLGYELQIASVTAIVLMAPGAVLLLLLERFLKSEYLVFFGQL
jgi:putative spermidine/putrescine transport system permease protein